LHGFEHLSVSVSDPGSMAVGTLGFRDVDGTERWEDLFGLGTLDDRAPPTVISFEVAPRAGAFSFAGAEAHPLSAGRP
jgi:hypothetical protein